VVSFYGFYFIFAFYGFSVFLDDFAIALRCLVCTLLFVFVCGSALSSSCVVFFLVLLFLVVEVWTVSVVVTTWAARTARLGVGAISRV
jgi:hypothetical protein